MRITCDKEKYDTLVSLFNDVQKNVRPSIKRALNKTAPKDRRVINQTAMKRYVAKTASRLKENELRIRKAQTQDLVAQIGNTSAPMPLSNFQMRKNTKRKAASARVLRSSSFKHLEIHGIKAFVTRVAWESKDGRSGLHTGIFERVGGSSLPIRQLYGPSKAKMAEMSTEEVRSDLQEILNRHIDEEIVRIMRGKK